MAPEIMCTASGSPKKSLPASPGVNPARGIFSEAGRWWFWNAALLLRSRMRGLVDEAVIPISVGAREM